MLHSNMMLDERTSLPDYLTRLQGSGRISFTRADAKQALQISDAALLKSAARLRQKHMLLNSGTAFTLPCRLSTIHGERRRPTGTSTI